MARSSIVDAYLEKNTGTTNTANNVGTASPNVASPTSTKRSSVVDAYLEETGQLTQHEAKLGSHRTYKETFSTNSDRNYSQTTQRIHLENQIKQSRDKLARLDRQNTFAPSYAIEKQKKEEQDNLDKLLSELIALDPTKVDFSTEERIADTISGAGKSSMGDYLNTLSYIMGIGNNEYGSKRLASDLAGEDEYQDLNQQSEELVGRVEAKGDELSAEGARDLEFAKHNSSALGSFLVDTGAAGIQLGMDATIGRLLPGGAQLSMGARAFGGSAREARQEGGSRLEQGLYGAANVATELLTEKMFDGLAGIYGKGAADDIVKKLTKKIDNPVGKAAIEALAGFGGEFTEEVIASAINPLLRTIYSDKTIKEEYSNEKISDMLYEGLIGGVLGSVTTTGGNVIRNSIQNAEAKKNYGSDVSALVEEALEINPDNKLAQKLQSKLAVGGSASGGQIRSLVEQNEEAMLRNDRAAIQGAVTERLTELGETENVESVAQALTKQATGEKLNKAEREAISGSKYGARVLNELQPHNIQGGNYSSDWAQNIGTQRINAEEYNRILDAAGVKRNSAVAEEKSGTPVPQSAWNVQKSVDNAAVSTEQQATARENRAVQEPVKEPLTTEKQPVVVEETATTTEPAAKASSVSQPAAATTDADTAYKQAYNMGKAGVTLERAKASVPTLTESQIESAYKAGAAASSKAANERATAIKQGANGKTGRRKGTVKGEGVKIADLTATFNDTQRKAYKVLSTIAEATGIDIVLYKSELNADGKFDRAYGEFTWKDNAIHIDINAGLSSIKDVDHLASYTMLRTFSHEFTHFIEKWNPEEYNGFRSLVFQQLEQQGENVHDLIETAIKKSGGKLSYDAASREVVAQAMTDILPDVNFVQELCEKHRTVFDKLLEKLKEFIQEIKDYYSSISKNSPKEAKALQEEINGSVRYLEDIVKMFDNVAVQAVENYQAAEAVEDEIDSKTAEIESEAEKTTAKSDDTSKNEPIEAKTEPEPEVADEETEIAETDEAPILQETKAEEATQAEATEEIPTKAETEEAKTELRKAVRMPIKGTNMEALLQGISSKELSMESITLPGSVDGFNAIQREYLVEALIKGVYTDKETISVAVPYDGKFEIENTPGNVAKVLDALNVKVTQEVFFDKSTVSALQAGGKLSITTVKGQVYATNGYLMLPTSEAGANYLKEEYEAKDVSLPGWAEELLDQTTIELTEAPAEGKVLKKSLYVFDVNGTNHYFDKSTFEFIDGGKLFISENGMMIKSVDENGNIIGYLMGLDKRVGTEVSNLKPAKLKSFPQKAKGETAEKPVEKQEKSALPEKKSQPDKKTKPDVSKPKASKELVSDETVKLNDFGEKIGGARKDLWSSRGLNEADLGEMNDREREKHTKKDNVWKRPDYVKLVEGGGDRGLLYAVNEIRKSLSQNISYRRSDNEEARRKKQELFIQTVREVQEMANNARTAEDFKRMGYAWGIENGYLEETGNLYRPYMVTAKYRDNPALSGGDYFETVEFLAKNFGKLGSLAEKAQFAVDAKSKLPKGYSIIQNSNDSTWFIAKGSWIVKDGIASYEEALQMLQNAIANKKKKTRFVPKQLLEVHRRGPNYRHGDNMTGQNYLDTFGFKGGEFGNWMSEKDRQVSLNYGYDALKDLAFALGVQDTDISLNGQLSIAFGSRGQGLSGAAAHYEPDRQVINLTKMNGAGSLAHEWFHGLDDFVGGFKKTFASDNVRSLPEATRKAMSNLITTMQYRDMTDFEADLAATKRYEQAQRSVSYQVKNQFNWATKMENGSLAEWEVKGFKRKPTQEDFEKYRSLLNSLLETGDAKYLEELSELRKEVVGRVIPKEDRESIAFRLYALKPAEGEKVQRGRVRSDFYNNSRRFGELHAKDGDYWDSTIEMAARAFACYVADKTGKNNDYLSGHSDSAATLDSDSEGNIRVVRAFPVGAERVAINEAFDQLISAMKEDGFLHDRVQEETPEEVQYQARENAIHKENLSGKEGKNFMEDKYFARQIDRFTSLKAGSYVTVGKIEKGSPIEAVGIPEGNLYFDVSKIKQEMAERRDPISPDTMKKIPKVLDKPMLITEYTDKKGNHSINVYGQLYIGNSPVVIGVMIGKHRNGLSVNKVQTVHPNRHFLDEVTAGNTLYLGENKKETNAWFQALGAHEPPLGGTKYGFIRRISYTETTSQEQNQQRDSLTDREVLTMAASEVNVEGLDAGERDALRIFNERLNKWEELQIERAELGRLYKEQQFSKNGDREAAKATKNRMDTLDGMIKKASAKVLEAEDAEVLKRVLQKARDVVEQHVRAQNYEELKNWRESRAEAAEVKKYRTRILKDVNELSEWVLHPGNKNVVKHIPDVIKDTVIPFITGIDFTSKRQLRGGAATQADRALMEQMKAVRDALKGNAEASGIYSGYNDLPADFMERLQEFIDNIQEHVNENSGEYVINRMSSAELKELSDVIRILKKFIKDMNRFHANAMYQHVYEAGDNTVEFLGGLKNASGNTGKVSDFVFWQQIRPAYAFERFGKGGMAIYDGLRKGQSTLAFNTIKIKEFAEKTYTAAEVQAWEKQVKTFKLGDDTVKIPVSAIMSFYELSKRPQALGHILGNGIRVATYKSKDGKVSDVGHVITPEDMNTIIGSLTERQKAVADQLQQFMAKQGGEWGNYVSVKRFGEEQFGEKEYFPINSDGRRLQATADEHPSAASLYALLNMSFTKELQQGANNRIVLYSIFDVFSNHMASMAQYNAFALPVLDALKWFNYQQEQSSVREQMARVFGVPEESRPGKGKQGYAESFVMNILKAFNGTEAQGVPADETGIKSLRRYNMAQVAFNFRVMVQQPLALTRAALLVDYKSIAKGVRLNSAEVKKNIDEMRKYSGIAVWKSLGFYDVNISRGLTDLIKHNTTWEDKVGDVGMKGAEFMDTLTWAGIWSACKEEVIRKRRISPKDAGFYDAVSKLFEDVVYKTQVVDSVLTKNEFLRSKGFFARAIASFMSEPTTTASMLIDAYDKYSMDMQRGMSRQQAWIKNRAMIGRVSYVYAVGGILLAAAQAVADAWRDDDDYQNFFEKWLEAFGGNLVDELMPFNKLPILGDVYDLSKEILSMVGVDTYGNPPQSVFMQWADSLVKGTEIIWDKIKGKETDYTWYGGIYKLLQAASGMSGLPMAAATREVITAWNNVAGALAPSLKVKDYEPSESNQIKYAYQDGWLTEEEAVEQLLEQGLVENEDEAYWAMRDWEVKDGSFSRYGAIYDAVRNGGDFKAAMDELTSHGYTEKQVISQVKTRIGDWYREGEITKQQTITMLTKYADMDAEEITKTVNKWSAKLVTGIAYEDIKQAYFDDEIAAARAVDMRVKYGGYTKEEAQETVAEWTFEKNYGYEYKDRAKAYETGKISSAQLRNVLMEIEGYTAEEADEQILVYEWEADGYKHVTAARVKAYDEFCKLEGVPKDIYLEIRYISDNTENDKDENGKSINYSAMKKVMSVIDSYPLTRAQKDAIAKSLGWSDKNIRKYKTW